MTDSAANLSDPAAPPRRRWPWLLALCFALLYGASFLSHCWLDTAPLSWDEAFMVRMPEQVAYALRHDGVAAAWKAFMHSDYHKPPLSMLATIPATVLFGCGNLSVRLDNLVAALFGGYGAWLLLRRHMPAGLALALAAGLLCAPFSLSFARTELAEIYVWANVIWFFLFLQRSDELRQRRAVVLAGLFAGLGLGSKLSFPLLVGIPALWLFARAMRRRPGERRAIFANVGIGLAVSAVVAFLLLAHNWGHIRNHVKNQYNWIGQLYSIGPKWQLRTLLTYLVTWREWFGVLALAVGGAGLLATLRPAARRGQAVALPLWIGGLVNFAYCYFHPVSDMRLTMGSFLQIWLCFAIVLGRAVADRPRLAASVAAVLGLGALYALLDHTYVGSADRSILGTAVTQQRVPRPPTQLPDLREAILAHYPEPQSPQAHVAFVGELTNLNQYNLTLTLLAQGREPRVAQLGYMARELTPVERVVAAASTRLWVVIDTGGEWGRQSVVAFTNAGVLEVLRAHPQLFKELDWVGQMGKDAKVRLFETTGDPRTLLPAGK